MSKFCWIYTTTSTKREAQKISDHLLEKHLIACANIFSGMESRYRWKGRSQKSREFALILKTRPSLFMKVEKEILKIHSYECPCVIQIPWTKSAKNFASWIETETR